MEKKDIKEILERYSSGDFTAEQEEMVRLWLFQLHEDDETGLSELNLNDASQKIWSRLETITPQPAKIVRLWPRIAVAASIALAVSVGGYFYYNNQHSKIEYTTTDVADIAPGKLGATLTLANGKKIRLSDAANGQLAREAGVSISKTADGQVIYEVKALPGGTVENNLDAINTMTTAKGETYILTLPDKSKVWINAASSLTYSAVLNERGQRRVKLSGEAYFQVAKDKNHPFIVESNGQEVEVLGTHFNISSYKDEHNTKTTLLEGSVKVRPAVGNGVVLKPNQQAELDGGRLQVKEVKAKYTIAWKDGYFMFNNENLEAVMTKIARWYKVQVVFEDETAKGGTYFGTISRYEDISNVLKMLSRTELVRFKIEGNIVKISKKK